MLLEEMMDDIIKKYGFEAKETIQFCHDCEVAKRKIATIIEKIEKEYQNYLEKAWQRNRVVIELNHQEKGENKNVWYLFRKR